MALLWLALLPAAAQSNLQFSQALLVGNTAATVPAGKVWKVSAIYGSENACVDRGNPDNSYWTWRRMYVTSFFVNGVEVKSQEVDHQSRRWCEPGCATCITNWPNDKFDRPASPNILPFWAPAGSTLQSGGPNTFLSVIEFNLIP